MSDKAEYQREFMRLKRAAKKAGLDHLPVSELRDLAARGKLTLPTAQHATTSHVAAKTAEQPGETHKTPTREKKATSKATQLLERVPDWGYALLFGGTLFLLLLLVVVVVSRLPTSPALPENDQAGGSYQPG